MNGMPQVNDNHRKLHRFAGQFTGTERMNPGPFGPGGDATGRYDGKVAMDGFFVVQDYAQEKDGKVTYQGHGIFGWDEQAQSVAWYWVDSMGFAPPSPARGKWHGDKLVLEHEPMGDRRGRYTFEFTGPDTYRFSIENSQDGGKSYQTFM